MNGCRVFFIVFYALCAFVGLIALGKGDVHLMIFGLLLMIFGLANAYATIGRSYAKPH